jgi:phosphatidate cytidylyltransferase
LPAAAEKAGAAFWGFARPAAPLTPPTFMLRVLSALVLLPIALGGIWFLPPLLLLAFAELVLLLAFREYVDLAARLGARVPPWPAGAAAMAVCAAFALPEAPVEVALAAAVVAILAVTVSSGPPRASVLHDVSAALLASLYLGLPLGLMVAIRIESGREAVLLLLITVVVSDSAQFYSGRLFGRRLLAPIISPKKTMEGAAGGVLAGMAVMLLLGGHWLPAAAPARLAALGGIVVLLGILGDLFESMLKRSAGVKDSSGLIPGHGGVLDRIDALLFAAPGYYIFLRYAL